MDRSSLAQDENRLQTRVHAVAGLRREPRPTQSERPHQPLFADERINSA